MERAVRLQHRRKLQYITAVATTATDTIRARSNIAVHITELIELLTSLFYTTQARAGCPEGLRAARPRGRGILGRPPDVAPRRHYSGSCPAA
jgi:hypothetical protein